tara:strand:+ start:813 stop:1283 length:471 start_codon:yes stop_codon:yes gene_type:complete
MINDKDSPTHTPEEESNLQNISNEFYGSNLTRPWEVTPLNITTTIKKLIEDYGHINVDGVSLMNVLRKEYPKNLQRIQEEDEIHSLEAYYAEKDKTPGQILCDVIAHTYSHLAKGEYTAAKVQLDYLKQIKFEDLSHQDRKVKLDATLRLETKLSC